MEKVLVFGHRNPDTDTICSAIAYAELKKKLGINAEAIRLGEINGETQFALEQFKIEIPRLVTKVSEETSNVILVDHNERQQSAEDIEKVTVMEVIDHHRISNFETAGPLYYRCEPVGCTATIVNKMYKEKNIDIPSNIAGLMLSAIISDSLLFKSPTCTKEDIAAAKELAIISQVDLEAYGLEMLKAGADLSDKTVEQLITIDAKEFQMGNAKVEIAQINAVDLQEVFERQNEIEEVLQNVINTKGLDLFMFVVTDILNSNSVALSLGNSASIVEQAYGVKIENNKVMLKGVVSRKKQIVPVLTEAFQNI